MYDTTEEANQKLRHSVVLFSKEPVYIVEAGGKPKQVSLHFQYLNDKKADRKDIREKDWNFRDLGSHLGYANIHEGANNYNEALYLTRIPVRQCSSTQGICQRNLSIPSFKGSSFLGLMPGGQYTWNQLCESKGFAEMFKDRYPTLKRLEDEFKNQWVTSSAFSRELAVRRSDVGPFYLQYKGKDIGYTEDFNRFKISKQYDYLRETMDYLNLKVA